MKRSSKAWLSYVATRVAGVAVDAGIVALAYLTAFALRFDFMEPVFGWRAVAMSFTTVCAVHVAALLSAGCYGVSWRRIRASGMLRCACATLLACMVLTAMRFFTPGFGFAHVRPPYSVTLICFFFATAGIVAVRYAWRLAWESLRDERRLLERDEKTFDNSVAARFFAGRRVLVTGAGGSIGSEVVRQVAAAGAAKVVMVERCENALYEIDRAMRGSGLPAASRPVMADCCDAERMRAVFDEEHPDIVLHAAAAKHVPMVELNPEEGWRNNVESTKVLSGLASEFGVRRFVLISTDKAVNPVSVMGRSKREAERVVMSAQGGTSFCAVRFGNVFGSSGSVVPLFREQIASGGPVTVTHPDMKRYFMTVREAVSLVLQAASRPERAVYTLDMGEPVRILDLAEHMIRQAGYRPYVDMQISFIGVRPGEKLFEELDISEKSAFKTDMAKIYVTKRRE